MTENSKIPTNGEISQINEVSHESIVEVDANLLPEDVTTVREAAGWDADVEEWRQCLEQNLANVSARDADGRVIGVGFLSGTIRHAELVDIVVHPDHREKGIGRQITQKLVDVAHEKGVKYFGLTYDTNSPWLKEFYESEGFEIINFGMWHKTSIDLKNHGK